MSYVEQSQGLVSNEISMTADLRFYRSLDERRHWILSETRFRVEHLKQHISEARLSFMTLGDASQRLLFALSGPFSICDEAESYRFVYSELRNSSLFPVLAAELEQARQSEHTLSEHQLVTHALSGILRFFRTVREELRSENLLAKLLDEFGNVYAGKERLEELFLLLERYREYQEANRSFDSSGVWESLLELLQATEETTWRRTRPFDGQFILDQVTEFTKLEQEVLRFLGTHAELRFTYSAADQLSISRSERIREVQAKLPRSQKSRAEAIAFQMETIKEGIPLEPIHARQALVSRLLDENEAEQTSLTAEGVQLWISGEVRDEVKRVLRAMRFSLDQGLLKRQELHLIALDFDLYAGLLVEQGREYGIDIWLPRGLRFSGTSIGTFLSSYLDWLRTPAAATLRQLVSHPLWRSAGPVWDELLRLVSLLGLPGRIQGIDEWRIPIERFLLADRSKETLRVSAADLQVALSELEEEFKTRAELLVCSVETVGKTFRRAFHQRRIRVRGKEISTLAERRVYVRALRLLRPLSEVSLRARILPEESAVFLEFLSITRDAISNAFCRWERPDGSIPLTELLDVRAMKGGVNILLGTSNEKFPGNRQPEEDDVNEAVRRVTQSGFDTAAYEPYSLIKHLLLESEELVFSYSKQTNTKELAPASFLRRLPANFSADRLIEPDASWSAILEPTCFKRTALIRARRSSSFTEFDGFLSERVMRARSASISVSSGAPNRYSASSLEQLADCPQRFFFNRLLGLQEIPLQLSDEIARVSGSVVHECLQRFFEPGDGGAELVQKNFSAAVKKMQQLATEQLATSEIEWDSHPLWIAAKRKILLGLDTPDPDAKRGYLKAALIYQRDFIKSTPLHVELDFGHISRNARPFILERGEQRVSLAGKIDRVDLLEGEMSDGALAVWDYKTGGIRTVTDVDAGRSLQVPLYALAVKHLFPARRYPHRGGLISLARPNRRDDEMSDPRKGVLIEHLAVSKKDITDPVAFRAERAEERIFELDEIYRKGNFSQVLTTKSCPWCTYRMICARDEQSLARKLDPQAEEAVERSLEKAVEVTLPARTLVTRLLSEEQEAVLRGTSELVLRAGAGSGKTFVMCARILDLLLAGERFEHIVAITFTEKAATEIKLRVEQLLETTLHVGSWQGTPLTPEEGGYLQRAQVEIQRSHIGTIHSFVSALLHRDSILAGTTIEGGLLFGGRRIELLRNLVEETLSREGREDTLSLLDAGISYYTLRQYLARFAGNENLLRALTPQESAEVREQILTFLKGEKVRRGEEIFACLREILSRWLAEVADWLAAAELKDTALDHFKRSQALAQDLLSILASRDETKVAEAFLALLTFLDTDRANAPRASKKNPTNYSKRLREDLEALDGPLRLTLSPHELEARSLEQVRVFYRLAVQVKDRFETEKRREGLLDFDDLILRAHRILFAELSQELEPRRTKLLENVARRYRHFLIDEFQDTDRTQWEIVWKLHSLSKEQQARASILVVGDRQQAIYGFRGGDVSVFDLAEKRIEQGGGEVLKLRDNYRSRAAVLGFINEVFPSLFSNSEGEPGTTDTMSFQELRAREVEGDPQGVEVRAIHQRPLADEEEGTEAEGVARYVRYVLEHQEEFPALLGKSAGKIAVLTRNARHLRLLARAFDVQRVPFTMSHSNGFYEFEEIAQFENLLRMLLNPNDEIAVVGVLRSPIGGFSDTELLEFFDCRSAGVSPPESFLSFESQVVLWRECAKFLAPSVLMERIVRELGLEQAYAQAGDGEAFRNIERFIDAAREAEHTAERASLPGILRWFQDQRFESSGAPNGNRSEHSVVLNTVHGAKGLEYPMVILPFLKPKRPNEFDFISGTLPGARGLEEFRLLSMRVENEDDGYVRQKTLLQSLLEENAARVRRSEEIRLFYVGCTRAESYLVFFIREGKTFLSDQASLDAMSELERRQYLAEREHPLDWLRGKMQLNDKENPSEWTLGSGQRVPITRLEELKLSC